MPAILFWSLVALAGTAIIWVGSNTFDLLICIPAGILIAGSAVIDFSVAAPMMAILTAATVLLFLMLRTRMRIDRTESVRAPAGVLRRLRRLDQPGDLRCRRPDTVAAADHAPLTAPGNRRAA